VLLGVIPNIFPSCILPIRPADPFCSKKSYFYGSCDTFLQPFYRLFVSPVRCTNSVIMKDVILCSLVALSELMDA